MRLNARVFAVSILFGALVASLHAQEKKERMLTTVIEVSIRSSNITDGTSNTVMVGELTMKVDPSGAFTGDITPAKDNLGNALPAIVFRGSDLYPDPTAPQALKVAGQINGHMLSFSVFVSDGTSNTTAVAEALPAIFGIGTSTVDLSTLDDGAISGAMAGTASVHMVRSDGAIGTRNGGEALGDWAASSSGVNIEFSDGSVRFVR